MAGKKTMEEMRIVYRGEKLGAYEKMARLYVRRPWSMCCGFYAVVLLMTGITMAAGWLEIKNIGLKDWSIASSDGSKNDDALEDARDRVDEASIGVAARSEEAGFTAMQFIYEWSDEARTDEILTPDTLQRICKFQSAITAHPDYPKFCRPAGPVAGASTACAADLFDLVAVFYPSVAAQGACALLAAVDFDAARLAMLTAAANETVVLPARFFLERATADPLTETLRKTRSQITLWGPLGADSTPDGAAFDEVLDDFDGDQADVYSDFMELLEAALFDRADIELEQAFSSGYNVGAFDLGGGLQVRFASFFWNQNEFARIITWDQSLAIGSIAFVGVAVFLHTRSLWITVSGLMSVILTLPAALFLFSGVLGIEYVTQLTIIIIYLILGLGADAIFVYIDAFHQSERYWHGMRGIATRADALKRNVYGTGDADMEILIARLAYTSSRAVGTVFNTSITTAAAFLATGVSPVTPISAFGFYAACVMLCLYVFSVVHFPAFAVISVQYFEGRPFCCGCFRGKREEAVAAAVSTDVSDSESQTPDADPTGETITVARPAHDETWEEKMFTKGYLPFVETQVGRARPVAIGWVLALLVLVSVMMSFAVQLDTPTEPDENFKSSHMSTGFESDYLNFFKGGSDFMNVEVVFGISGIDRDGFARFDPQGNRGTAIFDADFDLAPRANQEFVLGVCTDLAVLPCAFAGCVSDADLAVGKVDCTLQDFIDWHALAHPADTAALDLGDANRTLWVQRLREFSEVTGVTRDVGIVDGQLRFFVISYEATLRNIQPVGLKEPVLDLLDAFLDAKRAAAPAGLRSMFQRSFDFTWIVTERGIVQGMFDGLAISIPVAFLVLLIATSNVLLATFAVLAIGCIILSVLGLVQLLGWALGPVETIAVVLVVGLSVDFSTIHGTSYMHGAREGLSSRLERFRFSARMVGPTVLAGGITTAGAAVVMAGCQLSLFTRMAVLITSTIGFSLLYTEFFFMCLMMLAGPEAEQWNWRVWVQRMRGK